MIQFDIFCPNKHLIFVSPRCSECDWTRPHEVEAGRLALGPHALSRELGGPGRGMLSKPLVIDETALFPLAGGEELVALDLSTGKTLWESIVEKGRRMHGMVMDGDRVLAAVCDERPVEQAESGWLTSIDLSTGHQASLWTAESHVVGTPVLSGDRMIVRTGAPELVVFERCKLLKILWRRRLQTWWVAAEPVVAGHLILIADGKAMLGEGLLVAYDLASGDLVWKQATNGLLPDTPSVLGDRVFSQEGRKCMTARSLEDGHLLWKKEYRRIYTAPVVGEDQVFIVVRGSSDSAAPDHYLLQVVDPSTGQVVTEIPLNLRARQIALSLPDTVLLASDEGRLVALSCLDGRILWDACLGSEEDPLRSEITVANGLLITGTYSGKVSAWWVIPPSSGVKNSAEYIAREMWVEAACALALEGDLSGAGELYETRLGDSLKAYLLYERAGLWQRAGNLALQQAWYERAMNCFLKMNDFDGQARVLEAKGDDLGAAEFYEKAGKMRLAAQCYERGGKMSKARDCYLSSGDEDNAIRIGIDMDPDLKTIDLLERRGMLVEAGQRARRAGLGERAAKLFQTAGMPDLEMQVLQELSENEPDHWVLERLAALASEREQYAIEAHAWDLLVKKEKDNGQKADLEMEKAARAYHQAADFAARQDWHTHPQIKEGIAVLYEKAMRAYADCYLDDEQAICWKRLLFFAERPQIMVEGQADKAFVEGEHAVLHLNAKNQGFGLALEVQFSVNDKWFELDCDASNVFLNHLNVGKSNPLFLSIIPRIGTAGDTPLILSWKWKDSGRRLFSGKNTIIVRVKSKGDSTGGVQLAQVHYHGTVIQAEGGHVEMAGGDVVQGDQFTGDKVEAGGQKGDRVEIRRETSGASPIVSPGTGEICPDCKRPLETEGQCLVCGWQKKK